MIPVTRIYSLYLQTVLIIAGPVQMPQTVTVVWKLKASQLKHKYGLVSTSLSVDAAAIEKLGSSRNQSVSAHSFQT